MDAQQVVRVLVADDHPEVRSALVRLLNHTAEIEVVAAVATAHAAVATSQQLQPDVAVLDLNMPGSGLTAAKQLTPSGIAVIILTANDDPTWRTKATAAGVDRLIVKADGDDLVQAVLEAARRRH